MRGQEGKCPGRAGNVVKTLFRGVLRVLCWLPWHMGPRRMNSKDWRKVWRSRPVPACFTPGAVEWKYFLGWVRNIPALTRWWLWSASRRDIVRQFAELTVWHAVLNLAALSLCVMGCPKCCLAVVCVALLAGVGAGAFSLWATWFQGKFILGDYDRLFFPVRRDTQIPTRLADPDHYRSADLRWWREENSQAWCYVGLWSALWLPVSLALMFWSAQAILGLYGFLPGSGEQEGLAVWFQFVVDNVIRTPFDLAEIYGYDIARVRSVLWEGDHLILVARGLVSLFLVQGVVAIVRRRLMLMNTLNELDLYPLDREPPARLIRLGHWLFAPLAGRVMRRPDDEVSDPAMLERLRGKRLQALHVLDCLKDDRTPGLALELAVSDRDEEVALAALDYLLVDGDDDFVAELGRRAIGTGETERLRGLLERLPADTRALTSFENLVKCLSFGSIC